MARPAFHGLIRAAAISLAVAGLLAGCAGREDLAPVEYLGPSHPSSAVGDTAVPDVEAAPLAPVDRGGISATPLGTPPVAGPTTPAVAAAVPAAVGETTVAAGETLNAVSRRTGVPLRDLIELNGLQAPFTLQPGQRLRLPQTQSHTVAPGDTVYNISRRYGVDQASLMAENGIQPPYTIKLGQTLRIPGRVQAPVAAPVDTVAAPAPPLAGPPAAEPITIIEPDPDSLPPPRNSGLPPATTSAAAAPLPVPQPRRKPTPPPETAVAAAPAATAAPAAPARPAAPAATTPAPSAGAMRFAWPVAGDVISGFGPKSGGQHNDGINIQAASGTTVRAAEGGTVAYAGNEIRGFGNLVLIRHAGGWITAYAHNSTLLVKQGDKVARGQQIARVGNSGNVTVPQLHFEIRKGGTPVDPMKYLDGGTG